MIRAKKYKLEFINLAGCTCKSWEKQTNSTENFRTWIWTKRARGEQKALLKEANATSITSSPAISPSRSLESYFPFEKWKKTKPFPPQISIETEKRGKKRLQECARLSYASVQILAVRRKNRRKPEKIMNYTNQLIIKSSFSSKIFIKFPD